MKSRLIHLLLASCLFSSPVWAIGQQAAPLQHDWEVANYQTPADQRETSLEKLAERANRLAEQHPNNPEVLIWQAIIVSSYAGEKGGLGALGLVKQAKAALEQATRIDPNALQGSAYTTLGSLYYQVPGWPISFGDHKVALDYLQKALKIAPDSIDANYFYADFLFNEAQYPQALQAAQKARAAPARKDRPLADKGRQAEIRELIQKIQQRIDEEEW